MSEQTAPIEILLSREELLFVLSLLQAQFLPGLDEDPEGEIDSEQRALALRFARRALQARELLRPRANGEYALHNSLLRAVGVCAYAQSTIFAYHWASDSSTPIRTFFHIRGTDGVMHTRPDPALHRFTLIPATQIPIQIVEVCQLSPKDNQPEVEILVSNQAFLQARQQASNGDFQGAQQSLEIGGASRETAPIFAKSLASSAAVSILQIIKQNGSSILKQDITLVQNGDVEWIVEPISIGDERPLRIRSLKIESLMEAVAL